MLETILSHIIPPIIAGLVSIVVALLGIRQQNNKNQEEMKQFFSSQIGEIKTSQQELNNEIRIVKINYTSLKEEVTKHNNLIERMYKCENRLDIAEEKQRVANHRIEDLEKKV